MVADGQATRVSLVGQDVSPMPQAVALLRRAGHSTRDGIALNSVNIVDELHAIASVLRAAGIPYAVCGGIAVTAHGATRTTKDIDVALAREHLAAALAAVAPLGYNIPAAPMTFGAGTPQERHVLRVNKIVGAEHLVLDVLLAEAAYAGVLDDRIDVALPAGTVSFVSRETLIRMKRLAGRAIDLADIEKLESGDEV